ncbi:MAG: preprotein translocase subunit YajC [Clostridia bacterium]|nr:preprotein translocase subunit YajC [Clostridia bacterium]
MLFNTLLEGEAAPGLEAYSGIIVMVLLFVAMYFFMIRPQKKQEKKDAEMRQNLAVGDEVTTIGGIIGMVVSIKDETFVLETTKDKTKIRFLKGAVRTVDVKAADLAAQIMESKEAEAKDAEAADTEEKK